MWKWLLCRYSALVLLPLLAGAAHLEAPAGNRTASVAPQASILPGGRLLRPFGAQYTAGPGIFGLAVSPAGTRYVTADGGPAHFGLTFLEQSGSEWQTRQWVAPKKGEPAADADDWRSTFMGLAFDGENQLYASEGESGRVRLVNPATQRVLHVFDVNQGGAEDSYTGDLAIDPQRGLLYVLDQANFRVVVLDLRARRVLASVRVGRLPFAAALSPDRQRLYVTHVGTFAYQAIPGADRKRAKETGLSFPAFGFPSAEASVGADRQTEQGPVRVPGLGDPNAPESHSLCTIDVSNPEQPQVIGYVRTGKPFGRDVHGGSSPSGVAATRRYVFVSNAHQDSLSVIDAKTLRVVREIAIRIPGLTTLRGVLPIGLAVHGPTQTLLVAEAGINAVGIVDIATLRLRGHVPAGWFPTRVATHQGSVVVANAKGQGTGPNARRADGTTFQGELRRGSISRYSLANARARLPQLTRQVLANNGFLPKPGPPAPVPPQIRYVVMIVKENRTHDEVFGDISGDASLARFGRAVTPNHHALADRYAISDNFYADSEVSVDGHHWLVGSYPNAWTESSLMAAYGGQKTFRLPTRAPGRLLFAGSNSSVHPEEQPEAGSLWHHLERHGIPFRNYGEGFELAGADEGEGLKPTGLRVLTNVPMPDPLYRNTSREYPQYNTNIPDQFRADQFLRELQERYVSGKEPLPRFLFIHLPNDHIAKPRPEDGYPVAASFVADNDYALGRIVTALSQTRWWPQMAVLVTEDDAQGGVDSVDSHRTVMMVASPYAKRGYVSHRHSSFPGLLKTAFRLLRLPPLNLYDATATDLSDCFQTQPNLEPYPLQPANASIFTPSQAREPRDPKPAPRMDDPRVLREQHRRQP